MKRYLLTLLCLSGMQFFLHAQAPTWWQENSQTLSRLRNVNFVDNNIGWVFGDSSDFNGFITGIIMKSVNQGQTWTHQNMGSNNFRVYSSHFFNVSNGIAVGRHQVSGQGIVMRTTNGGATWNTDSVTVPERLFDVDFSSSNIGWISGRNGYLGRTNDGGITWNQQNSSTLEHLFSLDFIDTTFGWAVGADPGTGGTIIRTVDGGNTWALQTNTTLNDLMSVYAFNRAKVIAVGFAGTIVMTSDSGNTWTPVTSGTPEDLFDVTFTDPAHGWIVGTAGTILISSDSGLTWSPQVSNTTNAINSICMKDTTLGWYCGDNGDIFFYGTSPASVNEMSENVSMSIFPNPSNGLFTVQCEIGKIKNVKIYNVIGEEIFASGINNQWNSIVDLRSLPKGIYFIVIENTEGQLVSEKLLLGN